jgi:hypothetical protein
MNGNWAIVSVLSQSGQQVGMRVLAYENRESGLLVAYCPDIGGNIYLPLNPQAARCQYSITWLDRVRPRMEHPWQKDS